MSINSLPHMKFSLEIVKEAS